MSSRKFFPTPKKPGSPHCGHLRWLQIVKFDAVVLIFSFPMRFVPIPLKIGFLRKIIIVAVRNIKIPSVIMFLRKRL